MRQIILAAVFVGFHGAALAATAPLESHYSIKEVSAETTTLVKDLAKQSLVDDFLFKPLSAALIDSTYITSIEETAGTTIVDKTGSSSYVTYRKESQIFVSVAMPARISLLFSMEQRHRLCKVKASSAPTYLSFSDDDDEYSCKGDTGVRITGPLQVYGDYASSLQVEHILRNKQELMFVLAKASGGNGLIMESNFKINSALFEENLGKFLEFFGVVLKPDSSAGISPTGGLPVAMTRQRLLLAASRYLRQVNERILK